MERYFLAALLQVKNLGNAYLAKLMQGFASAEEIWQAGEADLLSAGLTKKVAASLIEWRQGNADEPKRLAEVCQQKGISLCTLADENYPLALKKIFDPPAVLFYRGELIADERRIAMVGARRCSAYGKGVAEEIGRALAAGGVTVVSGAARGIDTASHRGALKAGRTIAVLGCGIDVIYPPENDGLLSEIAAHGAVISEYFPGTSPLPVLFPARNRIISGLSSGVVVVEAANRSGSLITAELALSEGRDVFAVPGSIFSDSSRGCHRLIQQGARLVTSAGDIMEEYGWSPSDSAGNGARGKKTEKLPDMSQEEADIYKVLSFEHPLSIDEIIYSLHGSDEAGNVSFLLLQMEIKGLVKENETHDYLRAPRE